MDLTTAAVNFQQDKTLASVQVAVARKLLDMQKLQGSAAVKLIEAAANTGAKGGDELVAAATGLGGALDTYG
jgi:hypothetical protein